MRDVVAMANCHPNSIRRATEGSQPDLPCLKLPSGARRFRLTDVLKWLGQSTDSIAGDQQQGKQPGIIPVAATIRVSSAKQSYAKGESDRSSLEHQETRVAQFIKQRFGNRASVTWYKSIGSGLDFNRPAFLRLVEDILEGKYAGGYVVAQDFTRVCRFGIRLIEHLCKLGNCQILYAMDESEAEAKGEAETLTDEILSILTYYTAKASGAKAKKVCEVKVPQETMLEIWRLGKQGYSIRFIVKALRDAGRDKADDGRLITKAVVGRVLREQGRNLSRVFNETDSLALQNSFVQFFNQRVRLTGPESTCRRTNLVECYEKWCSPQGITPMSEKSIGRTLRVLLPNVSTKLSATGSLIYVGVAINNA